MAFSATFGVWADFKSHTSVTLPRYYVVRGDGYLSNAMGINASTGVAHLYTAGNEENIVVSGLGADVWFTGALDVITMGV